MQSRRTPRTTCPAKARFTRVKTYANPNRLPTPAIASSRDRPCQRHSQMAKQPAISSMAAKTKASRLRLTTRIGPPENFALALARSVLG